MNMVESLSGIDSVKQGFSQYEDKTRAVQTIMNATGEPIEAVNERLNKLIWFADETSYSFTDMTNNLGKFTAAGVDIDKATDAMIGISNWAAVSGAGVTEASRAMYNLSQAMSLGAVTTKDWMSIENANMATLEFKQAVIDTAIAMGKLTAEGKTLGKGTQVTAEGLRETLNEKWFDNDILVSVLGRYSEFTNLVYDEVQETGELCSDAMKAVADEMGESYDTIGEKAFKAAQEAKTFTDAVEAAKEGVKSQWALLFENAFGNYEDAKVLWTNLANTLYDVFAQPIADINEVFEEALGGDTISRSDWVKTLKDLHESTGLVCEDFEVFERAVMDTARKNGIAVDDMIEKYGDFRASLEEGWLTSDILNETFENIEEGTLEAGNSLEEVADVVRRVWEGEFGNIDTGRFEKLQELGWDPEFIQSLVNKGSDYVVTLDDISDSMLINMGYTEEEIALLRQIAAEADNAGSSLYELANRKSGKELLNEGLNNFVTAFGEYAVAAREAFQEVFGTLESGTIRKVIEGLHSLSERLLDESRIEAFKGVITNIATVLHVVFTTVKGIFTVAKALFNSTLGPVIKGLLRIGSSLFNGISGLFKQLDASTGYINAFSTAASWITEKLEPLRHVIEVISKAIAGLINNLFKGEGLNKSLKTFISYLTTNLFGYDVSKKITAITNKIIDFGSKVGNVFKNIGKNIRDNFDIQKFKDLGSDLGNTFKHIGEKFREAFDIFQGTELGKSLARAFDKLRERFSELWDSFSKWVKDKIKFGSDGNEEDFDFFASTKGVLQRFNEWLDNIDLESKMQRLSDGVMNLKDKIKSLFTGEGTGEGGKVSQFMGSTMEKAKGKIEEVKEAINFPEMKKGFTLENVLDNIKNVLNWIVEHAPSWRDILRTLGTVLKGGSLVAIITAFMSLKKLFQGGSGFLVNLNGILKGVKKALSGFAFKQYSTGILKLAAALAILTACLVALCYVDENKLMTVGFVLIGVASGLALLAYGISQIMNATGGKSGKEEDQFKGIKESISGFIDNIGEGIKKFITIQAYSIAMLEIAVSIGIIVAAIAGLSRLPIPDLIKGVVVLTILLGELALFLKALQTTTKGAKGTGIIQAGGTLLGLAVFMSRIVNVMKKLAKMELLDIAKSLAVMSVIMFALSKLIQSIGNTGQFKVGDAATILAMGVTLLLVSKALKKLSKLNVGGLLAATLSMIAVIGVLTAFFKHSDVGGAGGKGTAAALIGMGAAMLLFAMSIKALAGLEFGGILKGLAGILAVVGIIALLSKVVGNGGEGLKNIGMLLIGIAAAIVAVAAAIWLVAKALEGTDMQALQENLTALALTLVNTVIDTIVGSTDKIFGGLVGLLDGLITYVPQLVDKLVDIFLKVLHGLTVRMPDLADGIAEFIVTFMQEFGRAFEGVDISPLIDGINALLNSALKIAVLGKFGSIGGTLKGLAQVGIIFGAFTAVISALAGINELVKGLGGEEGDMLNFLKTGGELLAAIGQAIGEFVGSILGGIIGGGVKVAMEGISEAAHSLPQLGTDLSAFATNIETFVSVADSIPDDFLKHITDLAKGIMSITASEFLDSFTTFIEGILGIDTENKYVKHFESVADGIIAFQNKLGDGSIEPDKLRTARQAANVIADIANVGFPMPTAFDMFVEYINFYGSLKLPSSWDLMVDKTVSYATAIVEFCNKINENIDAINIDNIKKAQEVADLITTGNWPKATIGDAFVELVYDWADSITGKEDDLAPAARVAASYADAIIEFCRALNPNAGDIDEDVIDRASKVADVMGELDFPDHAYVDTGIKFFNLFSKDAGYGTITNTWEDNVPIATSYAEAIVAFSKAVYENDLYIDDEKAGKAAKVAEIMSSIQFPNQSLIDTGIKFFNLFSTKAGYGTLTNTWQDNVPIAASYAQAIVEFSKTINENIGVINNDEANAALSVANVISSMQFPTHSLIDTGINFFNLFSEKSGYGTVANTWQSNVPTAVSYAEAVVGFCKALNENKLEIDQEAVAKALAVAECMGVLMRDWPPIDEMSLMVDLPINFINAMASVDMPNTWDMMKDKVLSIAEAITGFAGILGDENFVVDEASLENAKAVSKTIIEVLGYKWPEWSVTDTFIDFYNGFVGFDVLDNTWEQLEERVKSMGRAIQAFSTNLGSDMISVTDAKNAVEATKSMVDILNLDWPTEKGGISGWFSRAWGEDTVSSSAITGMATNIKNFVDTLKDLDVTGVDNLKTIGTALSSIIGTEEPGSSSITNFSTWISGITDGIDELITTLATSFSDDDSSALMSAASSLADNIMAALNPSGDVTFETTGSDAIDAYSTGIIGQAETAKAAATVIIIAVVAIMAEVSSFSAAGVSAVNAYSAGMWLRSTYLNSVVIAIRKNVSNNLTDYNSFYRSGQSMVDGVIAGISSRYSLLISTTVNTANAFKNTWNSMFKINSPSKVMAESGKNIILGVVQGINDYSYDAENAARNSAQETINAMSSVLRGINTDDLDAAPTIRPVLDLSDIQNGAGLINRLLDTETTIGLSTLASTRLANAINNSGYDGVNQTYNDSNVIQTLNSLGDKVDGLNESILGMRVVINGKKLVGEIAGDMESELSGRIIKQRRGVM